MTVDFDLTIYVKHNLAHRISEGLKFIPVSQLIPKTKNFSLKKISMEYLEPNDEVISVEFVDKSPGKFTNHTIRLLFMADFSDDPDQFDLFKDLLDAPQKAGQSHRIADYFNLKLYTGDLKIENVDGVGTNPNILIQDVIALPQYGAKSFPADAELLFFQFGSTRGRCSQIWNQFCNDFNDVVKSRESKKKQQATLQLLFNDPDSNVFVFKIFDEKLIPVYDCMPTAQFAGITELIVDKLSEVESFDTIIYRMAEIAYNFNAIRYRLVKYIQEKTKK